MRAGPYRVLALPGRRGEPGIGRDLSPVVKVPGEPLGPENSGSGNRQGLPARTIGPCQGAPGARLAAAPKGAAARGPPVNGYRLMFVPRHGQLPPAPLAATSILLLAATRIR
jgi:hypothetical protein